MPLAGLGNGKRLDRVSQVSLASFVSQTGDLHIENCIVLGISVPREILYSGDFYFGYFCNWTFWVVPFPPSYFFQKGRGVSAKACNARLHLYLWLFILLKHCKFYFVF